MKSFQIGYNSLLILSLFTIVAFGLVYGERDLTFLSLNLRD